MTCHDCGNSGPWYDPIAADDDGVERCVPCRAGWRYVEADELRKRANMLIGEASKIERAAIRTARPQ